MIGTFTQQAIRTFSCPRPTSSGTGQAASISIAQTSLRAVEWTPGGSGENYAATLENSLKASLIGGLAGSHAPNALSPDCPSGNCSFGSTYTTVGFGSECVDISALITQTGLLSWGRPEDDASFDLTTTYSLPNGQSLTAQTGGFPVATGLWESLLSRSRAFNITLDQEPTSLGSVANLPKWLLENVTMTERQREIALYHAFDGLVFMMPTTSPCSYTLNDAVIGGRPPSVNVSSCPQLARSLPLVTSLPANVSVTATVCYFYPFLQNYNGAVRNGDLVEEPVGDPRPLDIRHPVYGGDDVSGPEQDYYWIYTFVEPCVIDNVTYTWNSSANLTAVPGGTTKIGNATGPTRCLYGFKGDWFWGLGVLWGGALGEIIMGKPPGNSNVGLSEACYSSSKEQETTIATNVTAMKCPQAWWLNDMYNGGNASIISVRAFMERGFASLTAQLRSIGTDWEGRPSVATGVAWEVVVCTRFRWAWLVYPLAMVLGTLVFLLGAVMASTCGLKVRGCKKRQAGLDQVNWKSSVLPFLFYGLEDAERQRGMALETEDALTRAAGTVRVRLTLEDDGWRLRVT